MNRRAFLAVTGGAAAAALAGCGDAEIGAPQSLHLVIAVSDFFSLATTGQLVKVGPSHAAKRTGATTFDAWSMRCTHAGCMTAIFGAAPSQQFGCPCHGSLFANDGSVVRGPATRALTSLPTSYDPATDTLTIN